MMTPLDPTVRGSDEESLSIAQATDRYQVSARTLRQRIARGDVDGAHKVRGPHGREWRLPVGSLEALGYERRDWQTAPPGEQTDRLRRMVRALGDELAFARQRVATLDRELGFAQMQLAKLRGELAAERAAANDSPRRLKAKDHAR